MTHSTTRDQVIDPGLVCCLTHPWGGVPPPGQQVGVDAHAGGRDDGVAAALEPGSSTRRPHLGYQGPGLKSSKTGR